MNNIEIIIAGIVDLDNVAKLFNAYRVFYNANSDNINLARSFIHARMKKNQSIIILAKNQKNQAIGFAQIYPTFSSVSAKEAFILNDLFVDEDFRGIGVASKLIAKVIGIAREQNVAWVSLQTAHDNFAAQSLYEKIGFIKDTNYLNYTIAP